MPTVSAFWGDREVSRSEAAEVVSLVLARMGAIDPALARWQKKGRSRGSALLQPVIDVGPDAIEAHLGVSREDIGGKPIPSLGFSFTAWNGARRPEDAAAVSATVGSHANNPSLRNSFVVDLPQSWEEADPRLQLLVGVLVGSLSPEEVSLFGRGTPIALWPDD